MLAGSSMNLIPNDTVMITIFMDIFFAGSQLWGGDACIIWDVVNYLQKKVTSPAK